VESDSCAIQTDDGFQQPNLNFVDSFFKYCLPESIKNAQTEADR
jgi:hypothetical protein